MAVSRAATKLEHALAEFQMDLSRWVCADFGCNAGGFTEVMLARGAQKVYAVDTGYGALDWNLRKDPRVVVMERTNAIHVNLPEKIDLVTIDVAWTRQRHILPAAMRALGATPARDAAEKKGTSLINDAIPSPEISDVPFLRGRVISLIKPHYEAQARQLRAGVLREEEMAEVLEQVRSDIAAAGFGILNWTQSPIKGAKGNVEFLALLGIAR